MLKVRKSIALLLAVTMSVAMCAMSPAMAAADTNKVMFIDFTDTSVDILPMTKTGEGVNAGGKITKNTGICYGAAKQSGLWYVSGSKSSLATYSIADSNMDMDKVAECNFFVIRFYSTFEKDQFSFVIKSSLATSPYLTKVVDITKSGWQEFAIPVSEITANLPSNDITAISTFCMYKGAYKATSFVAKNHIYFDSMWFEKRISPVVVDADNSALTLKGSNSNNQVSTNTAIKYTDSESSIAWYNKAAGGAAESVELSSLGLEDPTAFTTLTFRMYSEGADIVNLMLYYTNTSGATGKYVREPYTFSEEAGNIGKWVEVTLDLTDIDGSKHTNLKTAARKLENIQLNRGGWSTASTYNNNVYIDKIWFGDTEGDLYSVFKYNTSAYDDETNVGVYDTITLEFEDYLDTTIDCDAVTVKRDGVEVTEFDAWADRNFLCIKTDAAMEFESTYEITVTPALKDQRAYPLLGTHTISFTTESPCLAVDDVELVDISGNKLTALPAVGTRVVAKAKILNGSEEDETYAVIIAMYDDEDRFLGAKISPDTVFDANTDVEHNISIDDVVTADTAYIRGFLWKGISSLNPAKVAAKL